MSAAHASAVIRPTMSASPSLFGERGVVAAAGRVAD